MPIDNSRLKVLLFDIQVLAKAKFAEFAANPRTDRGGLKFIESKLDECIADFQQAAVWTQDVSYDPNAIFSRLVAISAVSSPDLDALKTAVKGMTDLLDETRPKVAPAIQTRGVGRARSAPAADAAAAPAATAPDRNQEALEGLQETRRKLNGRIRFFMGKRIDLASDEKFKKLRAQHKPLDDRYAQALRDKTVKAKETDIVLLKGFANAINAAEEVKALNQSYSELVTFIKERAPAQA